MGLKMTVDEFKANKSKITTWTYWWLAINSNSTPQTINTWMNYTKLIGFNLILPNDDITWNLQQNNIAFVDNWTYNVEFNLYTSGSAVWTEFEIAFFLWDSQINSATWIIKIDSATSVYNANIDCILEDVEEWDILDVRIKHDSWNNESILIRQWTLKVEKICW